jgi:hypothetical protein
MYPKGQASRKLKHLHDGNSRVQRSTLSNPANKKWNINYVLLAFFPFGRSPGCPDDVNKNGNSEDQ